MKYLSLIAAVLLSIGCFPLPIGFYTFLRIVVFVVCGILIWHDFEKGFNWSNISFGMIAIVFNPIIPIYLHDKTIWVVLDAIAAVVFSIKTYQLYKTE